MGERRGMKALELWARRVTDGYPGVKVDNMTTSWRNGLAFCALIHHFKPHLIDFESLDGRDIVKNNELAFRVAERELGIPALLDAEDMLEYEVPDRLSILTYLSQFYQVFHHQGSGTPVAKHKSSVTEIISPSSNTSAVKVGRGRVERCFSCNRPVFLAERLLVGGKLRHRSCFTCARCHHLLNPVSCYETEAGQFVCEVCPDEKPHNNDESRSQLDGSLPVDFHDKLEECGDDGEVSRDAPPPLPASPPPSFTDSDSPIKPPDPMKAKFLNDILDGKKTENSSDSGLSEINISSFSNCDALGATNLTVDVSSVENDQLNGSMTEEITDADAQQEIHTQDINNSKLIEETQEVNNSEIIEETENENSRELNVVTRELDVPLEPDKVDKNDMAVAKLHEKAPEENASSVQVIPKEEETSDEKEVNISLKLEDELNEESLNLDAEKSSTTEESGERTTSEKLDLENVVLKEKPTNDVEDLENLELLVNSPAPDARGTAVSIDVPVTIVTEVVYPTDLNPFGDSGEEEEEGQDADATKADAPKNPFDESDEEVSPMKPVPSPRSCLKVELNPDGKKVVVAPKSLNPFDSDSGEEPCEKPCPTRRAHLTPEPTPRMRSNFGSSSSLTSQTSSGKKKKRPAPPPPPLRRPSSPVSNLSSPCSSASRSPVAARRRKSKAPPPPPAMVGKDRKDYENKVKQNQLSPPSDKSTYGQWKRKKGAAPGLPVPPQRRRIVVAPLADINQEVEDLEVQQNELERQGVQLEQTIRKMDEGGEEEGGERVVSAVDVEELVLQLFEIVNQKNELFRRQAELMFLRKQQRLEEEHADIEYQIRCLMGRPKDQADPQLEEQLITRLVDVVERRNDIIDCLDMNRRRAAEEDQSIHDTLMAFTTRDTGTLDSTAEEESSATKKSSKSVLKLLKKKREKRKEKEMMEKKRKDADVDVDTSAPEESLDKSKGKKKWFKVEIAQHKA